ncbi:MAG: sensor histidine kinase, partial [Planctomycetota bacterium]
RIFYGPANLAARALNEGAAEYYLTDDSPLERQRIINGHHDRRRPASQRNSISSQDIASEVQATIGHIARGLAHELNNPLAVIFGYAQRLQLKAGDPVQVTKRAGTIITETQRCTNILDRLRALGYNNCGTPRSCTIAELLPETIERLPPRNQPTPMVELATDLPLVKAPTLAIIRSLVAIIDNARLADARHIHIDGQRQGSDVILSIVNDGESPDDEVVAHATRPLFTTRSDAGHSGLGLALTSNMIRDAGGSFQFAARSDGPGATITIRLPAAQEPRAPTGTTSSAQRPAVAASPFLVIDDEPIITELIATLLEDIDLSAICCTSAEEAAQCLASKNVGSMLCDLHLPDGNGRDVILAALDSHPHLRGHVAVMTGDPDSPDALRLRDEHGCHILAKPFAAADARQLFLTIAP